MRQLLQGFGRDQSGATAIEYGLIASLIFVVIAGTLLALGDRTTGMYARIADAIVPVLDAALGGGDGGSGDSGGGEDNTPSPPA